MVNVRHKPMDPLPLLFLLAFMGVWLGLESPKERRPETPADDE